MMNTIKPKRSAAERRIATGSTSISVMDPTAGLIQAHGRLLWTTSLHIADRFQKRHDNVLRAIANLDCSDNFHRLNFEERDYADERGKSYKSYDITRDGFSLLAMGFTGQCAAKWKEHFIAAFGRMEQEPIRIGDRMADPMLHIAIREKCAVAILMTDCLVEVRMALGKETKPHHYSNEHSLCNWVLTGQYGQVDDSGLDRLELRRLTDIRRRNTVLIVTGLNYAVRKDALREAFPLLQLEHAHD
jgi:Rha family phage regulatory protein